MRTLRFRPRPQGVRSPSECQGSTQPRHCWCSQTLLSYGDNDATSCHIHTVGQISPAGTGQRKPCLCKEKRSKNNEKKKNPDHSRDLAAQIGQSDLLAQAFWQIVFSVHGKSVLGTVSQHVGSLGGCNMLSQTTHYQCHRASRSLVGQSEQHQTKPPDLCAKGTRSMSLPSTHSCLSSHSGHDCLALQLL